jgi:Ca2+-binding RTX toxin-like protein
MHTHASARDRHAATVRGAIAIALICALMASLLTATARQAQAVTDENPSFEVIASDLEFILKQIKISESHAAGNPLLCASEQDTSGTCVPSPFLPWGLRTVDGSFNNLMPGRSHYGSADQVFPRLLPIDLRPGEVPPQGAPPGPNGPFSPTHYQQTSGFVYDSQPRVASNLVVDLTTNNPAAVAAAERVDGSETAEDGRIFIPNEMPDEGLSAPFNTWMTFFGQFFDHGLDLVDKGGSGTVVVPLQEDDPLYDPDSNANFLMLTRATNRPGPDGILGTADDVREHNNQTTPFVDQNQTYTSHPSHQVFLREYQLVGGRPVDTGHLLDGAAGGLANWAEVKAQARNVLGIDLVDRDVTNVPLVATDPYGNFLPGPNGFPRIVLEDNSMVEGDPTAPISTQTAQGTGHAFLDDIAHGAAPQFGDEGQAQYDVDLLDAHFVTGDGRGNENIGLTAVHHVFHAEHNRLVGHIEDVLAANPNLRARYQNEGAEYRWNYQQRLFQASRYVTEMQYQHLVFEEFARTIQPFIDVVPLNESGYHLNIDAAITAEFAHVVYRFGHSMLTETVERQGFGTESMSLFDAFLNPHAFTMNGTLTPEQAAGSVVMGAVNQAGSGIDEFVTETLRNELLGLPLDLATINMMRGRDVGIPPLQTARQRFYTLTGDLDLKPYTNWVDFGHALKHPESLVNFVAAYGTHPDIVGAGTLEGRRAVAQQLVDGDDAWLYSSPATSGLNDVDFWLGGLAEANIPFMGMLGPTFNYVFESQLENLQFGDRFYYLSRNIGLNLFHQLEANSFSALIMRTTDAELLPAEIFSTPDHVFDLRRPEAELLAAGLIKEADGTWRYTGDEHISMHGTSGNDRMRGGIGDDALWGYDGNDHITGGAGANAIVGGRGDDRLFGLGGDDNLKGGAGNDLLHGGSGEDLLLGGSGKDFIIHGSDRTQSFGGTGDDFILGGGAADIIAGNEGDDWLEGGPGADLVQGDNSNGFQDDPNGGHDVLWGGPGNDDHDAEGGDDIMIASLGSDRHEGMLGFDWVTWRGVSEGAVVDMDNTVFQPPSVGNFRSRFDLVEGVSGWAHDDVLRGVGANDENDGVGHELTQAHLDRVAGLRVLLGGGANPPYAAPFMTANNRNNILLGGGGSDVIEGRGGDDFIDGSAWLNVQLEANGERFDSLAQLQERVISGQLNPGAITIVREIRFDGDGPDDVNTAVFSDDLANYRITENGDGTLEVAHLVSLEAGPDVVGGAVGDGVDVLRNIHRLEFADQVVDLTGGNSPAEGQPVIVDDATGEAVGTPQQGQTLRADIGGVTDADGIDANTLLYEWQVESETEEDVFGPIATAANEATFTPGIDEVGRRLRVVVVFNDNAGVLESVTSDPTAPVVGDGQPVPAAAVSPDGIDFGQLTVGQTSAPQVVTVSSTGDADLVVSDVSLSDPAAGFAITANTCGTVAPGGTCSISVTFAPTAAGDREADLVITHNAGGNPATVGLKGTGVVVEVASPTATLQGSTNFGTRRVGTARDQLIRVQNNGPGQLFVSSITVDGSASFSLVSHTCQAALPVRGRCDVVVRFAPEAAGGHAATLSVVSNASNSPTAASLTGSGR